MPETERKPLPPYMPYKTFVTFLDHLRAIGVPSHIDKSVMTHMSGGMQSWLKAALKYMKLINADDTPTDRLAGLVSADGDLRKEQMRALFDSSYKFVTSKLDLKNTTPVKLREVIIDAGAQGETVEKIIAFMIAMGKDADVQMSSLLTKRAPTMRRQRTKPATRTTQTIPDDEPDGDDDAPPDSAMKTISLPKSGGTITLSGNINIFELVGAERDLVFSLIDTMRKFEESQEVGV